MIDWKKPLRGYLRCQRLPKPTHSHLYRCLEDSESLRQYGSWRAGTMYLAKLFLAPAGKLEGKEDQHGPNGKDADDRLEDEQHGLTDLAPLQPHAHRCPEARHHEQSKQQPHRQPTDVIRNGNIAEPKGKGQVEDEPEHPLCEHR